jgi:hypothetical protein
VAGPKDVLKAAAPKGGGGSEVDTKAVSAQGSGAEGRVVAGGECKSD